MPALNIISIISSLVLLTLSIINIAQIISNHNGSSADHAKIIKHIAVNI